jgi:hypothetical protein
MKLLHCAAMVAALTVAAAAHAHDSWLRPAPESKAGAPSLQLTTGNRYPLQEFGQSVGSVARSGCIDSVGTRRALRPQRQQDKWLDLEAVPGKRAAPLACWLELKTAEVEIEPRLVQVYFAEIRASAAIRETWDTMRSRGLPWRESYRKFARIELADAAPAGKALAQARRPVGLGLELVVLGGDSIAVGQPLEFQLLRDGQPLAGQPVELVSERNPLGIWRETDDQGRLRHVLPFGGRWLLRAVDLRVSGEDPDRWNSRFVTLAIEAR